MLGIAAEFYALEGRHAVILQDLSATGARIELKGDRPSAQGFLRWMGYEVFADIRWRRGKWCGMAFDRPISNACLFATRTATPQHLAQDRENAAKHARDFVNGI